MTLHVPFWLLARFVFVLSPINHVLQHVTQAYWVGYIG